MRMDANGTIHNGEGRVGHVVYEDENQLAGGTITSNFVYADNDALSINGYLAFQLGSNLHLFATTNVYMSLPKAVHYDGSDEEVPIIGIDRLGTYTAIGGPLHKRYVYVTIPEGYTFIGNYAFFLMGSDHADSCIEFNIPSSVEYIGHEAFNFSTLNHMKDMNDQKYKFRVNYEGTASEFIALIEKSKTIYEKNYVGVKKDELESKAILFQNNVDDTGHHL